MEVFMSESAFDSLTQCVYWHTGRIGAHFQIGSFNEITPAFVTIGRRLRLL